MLSQGVCGSFCFSPTNCGAKWTTNSGINGRIYMFARDKVYQVWHEDGLPQKVCNCDRRSNPCCFQASYLITDLFTGGPRTVTAALTNSRSGVTILISGRTAYRFRWNKKHKRFQVSSGILLENKKKPYKFSARQKHSPRDAEKRDDHPPDRIWVVRRKPSGYVG